MPFEVYAKPHIRGEILHYLRDGVALVRLPRGVEEEGLRLSRRRSEHLNPREQMVLEHYRGKQKWSSLDHAIHPETSDHMASLPPLERSAVEATVLEGLSLRAAAHRFQVSAMTIQRRLKRGLGQMARSLEKDQLSV